MFAKGKNIGTVLSYWEIGLLFILSFGGVAQAQVGPSELFGQDEGESIDVSEHVEIYIDSLGDIKFLDIPDEYFMPSQDAFAKINPKKLPKYTIYFRLTIVNKTTDSLKYVLQVPWAEMVTVYSKGQTKYGGNHSKPDGRDYRFMENSFLIDLLPKEVQPISGILKYARFRENHFAKKFFLQKEEFAFKDLYKSDYAAINYKFALLSTGFLFSICFVFLFMFLHYVQTRDKLYLYYSLYLLVVIFYSFINYESVAYINVSPFGGFNRLGYLKNPLGIIVNGFYFYFISNFLDLKVSMPRVHRWMNTLVNALYVYVIIGIIIGPVLGHYYLEKMVYFGVRILWFVPSLIFLIAIWRKQIKYGRIVLIGTLVLIFGSLVSLVLTLTLKEIDSFWKLPIIYTQIAILVEIAFFSLGVGRKIRDNEMERLTAKEELIDQLETNSKLQTKINTQLKEKVKWQESLAERQALELDKEKALSESSELQKQLAQMELLALRSQMNPHFIFNSLNSIKSYILRSGPLEAAEYLTSFSNLMRSILQNSKNTQISLKDEIDTLLLYVKLEQMRFPEKFKFIFFQKSRMSLDSVMVPPLILQPYVENAIWHGLLHANKKGLLKVEVLENENDCLVVIIEDDGIGREQAAKLKAQSLKNYKSMGMGITKSRIELHNQINAKGIKVEVTDVFKDRKMTGTRVKITVKCPFAQKNKNDESDIN
ncbi:MAG TPA: hypothetical protein ENK85_01165 [Saprospiraceae bacterium]|nr:hypothetical protein [Saprospiraceae bacterium]